MTLVLGAKFYSSSHELDHYKRHVINDFHIRVYTFLKLGTKMKSMSFDDMQV